MAGVRPPSHVDDVGSRVASRRLEDPELDSAVLEAARRDEKARALGEEAKHIGTVWSPSRRNEHRFIAVFARGERTFELEIIDGAVVELRERRGR